MPNDQDTSDSSPGGSISERESSPTSPFGESIQETSSGPDQGEQHIAFWGSFYRGPLPPPAVLDQYNQISPGAAKIIIDAFDRQSKHRQKIEQTEVLLYGRNSKWGMRFAFIIGMTAIISGVALGDLSGAAVVVWTIATLAAAFFRGSKKTEEHKAEGQPSNDKQLKLPLPPEVS